MSKDLDKYTKADLIKMLKEQTNFLEVNIDEGHYVLELPEGYNVILIFNSMEEAIEYTLDLEEPIKPSDIKILSFKRGEKGYEINQVSGTEISDYLYDIARKK